RTPCRFSDHDGYCRAVLGDQLFAARPAEQERQNVFEGSPGEVELVEGPSFSIADPRCFRPSGRPVRGQCSGRNAVFGSSRCVQNVAVIKCGRLRWLWWVRWLWRLRLKVTALGPSGGSRSHPRAGDGLLSRQSFHPAFRDNRPIKAKNSDFSGPLETEMSSFSSKAID